MKFRSKKISWNQINHFYKFSSSYPKILRQFKKKCFISVDEFFYLTFSNFSILLWSKGREVMGLWNWNSAYSNWAFITIKLIQVVLKYF